ncbi:hypothetical protein [Saccharospirillum salsuginis]|uniref:Uncharacterized protein n=1 Tax=Saccharospirillum salsuginis TaxID=418750 RepID=A0A918KK01_9GAMM|nr:hypothetical protein [Saccharospirillum salsuginis]GGX66462.1 hypothetical protein GCM10007392_37680 [Saccharospirillum salsuginis]
MSVFDEETKPSIPAGYQSIHWFALPQPVASRLRPIIQNDGGFCWLQRIRVEGLNWLVEPVPSDQVLILWDGRQARHIERSVCSAMDRGQPYLFRKFPNESKTGGSSGTASHSTRQTHETEHGEGERSRWGGGRFTGPPHFNVTVHIYDPLDGIHPKPPELELGERPIHPSREAYQLGEDESVFDLARRLYGLPILKPLLNLNERHSYDRLPAPGSRIQVPGYRLPISGSANPQTKSISLTWDGPTEGQQNLPFQPGPAATSGEPRFWDFRIPVKAGDYQLTARNGTVEHRRTIRIEPPSNPRAQPLDVCYRPETGELLLVTDYLTHQIDTDSQLIDDALLALNEAVEADDAEAIPEKKAAVMKALAPAGRSDTGIAGLTELAGYKGRKATYVRSDKIANHVRRYGLAVTVRDERRFTDATGSFDAAKAQRTLKEDYQGGLEKVDFKLSLAQFDTAMTDWAESWNETTGQKRDWLADSELFTATTEAAVMRLMAGASLSASVSKTAIGLAANASASAALAEGKVTVESHFPDKDGFALQLELKDKHSPDTTTLDFGAVRASMIIELIGFSGAKALVCANVELSMEGSKAALKGLTDSEAEEKAESDEDFEPHPPVQGADVGASAFAGISGGCGVKGALEWDNPEKRTGDEPAFSAFAEMGGEFNAQAGAGAEAKLYVAFDDGKFMVRSRVGACFGVGAAGALVASVNVDTITSFIQCIYHQLMKFDFRKLEFINEEAFQAFHQVISGALQLGENVFDCLLDTVRDIDEWWGALKLMSEQDEQAKQLAINILKDEQGLIQFAPPEAKASILRKLCMVEGKYGNIGLTGFNEYREEAVIKVLSTVTCERELVEIVERMGPDGPVHPSSTDWDAWRGFELLSDFLDGKEQRLFNRWYDQLPKTAIKDVKAEVAALMAQPSVRLV